jgi:GT2 family glycosyltransferase
MVTVGTIIPCHNRKELTVNCISTLLEISKHNFCHRIYIVDDGSKDGTKEAIAKQFQDKVTVLEGDGNLFWTGAINMGIKKALSDGCNYIHLMNDDIKFNHDFLTKLMEAGQKNREAIIGSITCSIKKPSRVVRGGVLLTNRITQPWIEIKNLNIDEQSLKQCYDVDSLSGRSAVIPSKVFDSIGDFDCKRFPHSFADFDFFFRAKKNGFSISINPESIIYTEIEPKLLASLIKQPKSLAIKDLWFDRKYFSIITFLYLSKQAKYRFCFMTYLFAQRIKWTALILFCDKKRICEMFNGHGI